MAEVFKRHVDDVWWLLRRLGVAEAHCDDATQEVFLIVRRRLPEYEPRDRLMGWLGAIVANVAARFRRSQARARTQTIEADPDGTEADALDLEKEVASAEEVTRVLEEVDPDLCFVFIQHHLEEVSIAEMAKHLRVSEGTVKSQLRLARAAVKAAWIRYKARERRMDHSNVVPIFGPLTFLEAGRQTPRLPDEVRARIWAGIERTRLGGGDGGGGSGGGDGDQRPASPVSALRPLALRGALPARPLVAAGLLGVGLVVGVVLGAVWDPLHRSQSPAATTPSSESTALAVPPALASPEPSVVPAEIPNDALKGTMGPAPPTSAPTGTAGDNATGSLALEQAMMEKAGAALAAGAPDAALVAVREHAAMFHGGGRLAQHREAFWIAALIRAGRTHEARERLARFAALYPQSPRLGELREALLSSP